MRAALVLHIFYEDIAEKLIATITRLGQRFDVFVTTPLTLSNGVRRALDDLETNVEIVRSANLGRDVGPFLELLPRLFGRYDVFCKLQTKKGSSGYATEWRTAMVEALVGSQVIVDGILQKFSREKRVAIIGPEALFLSVARHLPANPESLLRLAKLAYPGRSIPSDWGFFAGTMFWGRTDAFRSMARLREYVELEADNTASDGQVAHAVERVFGLAGLMDGNACALVRIDDAQLPSITEGTAGSTPPETLQQRLMQLKAERLAAVRELSPTATELKENNPLVDYIETALDGDLDPNSFFHNAWFVATNPGLKQSGSNPLRHFISAGAASGANPSPLFNTGYYFQTHPGLFGSGINPLIHFLEGGQKAGDDPLPPALAGSGEGWPKPKYLRSQIDLEEAAAFRARLAELPADMREAARSTPVSVIVPIFDGSEGVEESLGSIDWQTHANLEIIVVDATDSQSWADRSERRLRTKIVRACRRSPAEAMNLGLKEASGKVWTRLDAGNSWHLDFIETMLLFMRAEGVEFAYCIAELNDAKEPFGYLGNQFDWDSSLKGAAFATNTCCCGIDLYRKLGGYDEGTSLADWDLVLRYAKGRTVGFAPFVGCRYVGTAAMARLLAKPPMVIERTIVRARHLDSPKRPGTSSSAPLSLNIGIKVAAPEGTHHQWGDYHFAIALKEALERQGHSAIVDLHGDWYRRQESPDDVVIVLRGPHRYEPNPSEFNVLWNISQPEQVSFEEYESYRIVYVASESYAAFLSSFLRIPVRTLLQATDVQRFRSDTDGRAVGHDILFVGNTRGEFRQIVRWAIEEGFDPAIYGANWESFVSSSLIKGEYIDNRSLPALYRAAGWVLNDHLASMREFGFVSNRLFDIVASGGNAVSDHIPSIPRIFGRSVRTVRSRSDLRSLLRANRAPAERAQAHRASIGRIARLHSFDRRAATIIADVSDAVGIKTGRLERSNRTERRKRKKIRLLLRKDDGHPDNAAFRRLISPLTDEVAGEFEIELSDVARLPLSNDTDVCVAQIGAVGNPEEANDLVGGLRAAGIPLVVDADIDASTLPANRQAASKILLAEADQSWLANDTLLETHPPDGSVHIVPTGIDPRIWRDYRQSDGGRTSSELRFLLLERSARRGALEPILAAFGHLAGHDATEFAVYAVTGADIPSRPWLIRLQPPPAATSYPRFARWLRLQGPFDVGIAKTENAKDADNRFLEFSAMGLMSVLGGAHGEWDVQAREFAAFVPDTEAGWFAAFAQILRDRNSRVTTARLAKDYVWGNRSTSQVAVKQVRLLKTAVAKAHRRAP